MDGAIVERELRRGSPFDDDALSGFWDSVKSAVKGTASVARGAAVEGAKAAVGTAAGAITSRIGPGATTAAPSPTKVPKGMYIALAVVAVLGLYAYSRSKKARA